MTNLILDPELEATLRKRAGRPKISTTEFKEQLILLQTLIRKAFTDANLASNQMGQWIEWHKGDECYIGDPPSHYTVPLLDAIAEIRICTTAIHALIEMKLEHKLLTTTEEN